MKRKKLKLNRETLRNLSGDELGNAAGGTFSFGITCQGCTNVGCPPGSEGCTRPISPCNSCESRCEPYETCFCTVGC